MMRSQPPKGGTHDGVSPGRSGSKPGVGALKSLGDRISEKLTRWGSRTRANISHKLGRNDSSESDQEDSSGEGRTVEFDAERLAKDVQKEVEREMGEFASSGSASAHSTVTADGAGPAVAAATSSNATNQQQGTGVTFLGKNFAQSMLLQGASMRNLFRGATKSPLGSQKDITAGLEDADGSSGAISRRENDAGDEHALAKPGIRSKRRRGSFAIQLYHDDAAAKETTWISRSDFARRRFTMSSNAWRLNGVDSHQYSRKHTEFTSPKERVKETRLPLEMSGAELDIGRAGSHQKPNGIEQASSCEEILHKGGQQAASKHQNDFQTPVASKTATHSNPSPFYRSRESKSKIKEERVTLALNGSGGLLQCLLDVPDADPVQLCNVSNIVECKEVFVGSPYDDAFMITFTDTKSDREGELLDEKESAAPLLAYATFAVSSKETLDQWMGLLMPIKAGKSGTDMFKQVRALVSGNRKRYQDETFDLDLSYVTPRCIAMAFPGQDTVGPFSTALRNDMKDVRRFFEEKHRGCYMIFNLCAEKSYDAANFNGMFEHIPFLDHNPPTLRQLKHFCNVATRWCLQRHNNVVAVHCKGGKGRTGVMVACWLLADAHNEGKPMTYQEAIDKFIEGRTQDMDKGQPQGPTCASQLRYIKYFDKALRNDVPNRVIRIKKFTMRTVPVVETGTYRPYLRISCLGHEVYQGYPSKGASFMAGASDQVDLDLSDHEVIVKEDFKVEMFNGKPKNYADEQRLADKATFFMCLHTGFLREPGSGEQTMLFSKKDVDGPHKDDSHKRFRKDFKFEMGYEEKEADQRHVVYNEDIEHRVMQRLYEKFKPYQIRSGETIAKQGDKGDQRLFLVAEGSVRKEITTRGSDGGTFVTEKNFLMYGEGGFLFNKPRTGDVITNQDTLVYAVSSDDVANIFGNDAWSLYSLIATQLAHKQTAKSNNKNIKDQQDALLENAIPKKLSQAHALPQSEIILSSGKCQATSRSLAKGHGTLFIMRRYVLFHASSWKGGSSSVIYSRDILRVEGPSVVVGKGGIIGLIVRVVKSDGRVQAQEVQLSFALIHVASDIAEYLRTVTRRQHDFRMTSTNKITDLAAYSVLPEIFKTGSLRMVETFTPSQQISPEEMQHRLYCVVHGHALYKNGAGAVVDRHEIGKIFGEVAFVEQKTRQRGKKDGAIFAGNHGMVVVSMSFAHVRALLETNSDLATRFYEYVAKVMYGRLSQSLYMMSDA